MNEHEAREIVQLAGERLTDLTNRIERAVKLAQQERDDPSPTFPDAIIDILTRPQIPDHEGDPED